MTMMTKDCTKNSTSSKPDLEAEAKALKNVLNVHESPQSKLDCLIQKYVELAHMHKGIKTQQEEVQKRHDSVQDERDHLQASYNRANLAKSKLESLCRELQRHVKCLKEEYDQRNKEEDMKRKEIAERFQVTINDINQKMQENQKSNQTLREDNMELASKLRSLLEEYKTREEHVEKILKQKSLEIQLWETKLAQQAMQGAEDKQKELTEKRNLLQEYVKEKKKNEILVEQEQELRNQLALYTEKFEEFQKTLTRSNDVFATFKQEMSKMSKTIKKLEKENVTWKGKHEQTSKSMFTMAEELRNSKNKNEKLEKLCRALQVENKHCREQISEMKKKATPVKPAAPLVSSPDQTAPPAVSSPDLTDAVSSPNKTDPPSDSVTEKTPPVSVTAVVLEETIPDDGAEDGVETTGDVAPGDVETTGEVAPGDVEMTGEVAPGDEEVYAINGEMAERVAQLMKEREGEDDRPYSPTSDE